MQHNQSSHTTWSAPKDNELALVARGQKVPSTTLNLQQQQNLNNKQCPKQRFATTYAKKEKQIAMLLLVLNTSLVSRNKHGECEP